MATVTASAKVEALTDLVLKTERATGLGATALSGVTSFEWRGHDAAPRGRVRRLSAEAHVAGRVSVIIPTLQEGQTVAGAVRSARRAGADEVIVSDAGSRDDTIANARRAGATVIRGARGRGPQLNAGAAAARGDILWFIHADARVAPGSGDAIRTALRDPAVVGGNFRIRFGTSKHGRFLAAFYHAIRQLRMFYGDSAIFCRRSVFDAVGGFPPYPIMEDLEFVHALYRQGGMAYLSGPVRASPRRWEQGGLARTWASWLVIQVLYFARVDPHELARLYRHIR